MDIKHSHISKWSLWDKSSGFDLTHFFHSWVCMMSLWVVSMVVIISCEQKPAKPSDCEGQPMSRNLDWRQGDEFRGTALRPSMKQIRIILNCEIMQSYPKSKIEEMELKITINPNTYTNDCLLSAVFHSYIMFQTNNSNHCDSLSHVMSQIALWARRNLWKWLVFFRPLTSHSLNAHWHHKRTQKALEVEQIQILYITVVFKD